jgi:hypothetical protein
VLVHGPGEVEKRAHHRQEDDSVLVPGAYPAPACGRLSRMRSLEAGLADLSREPGFPENRASLVLHGRAGFRVVGVYRRHGRLDGEWRNCVIVERLLGEAARD